MEDLSFIINYFNRLRRKAHELDKKLEQLRETWKTPHLLIGGYAERTAEADAFLKMMRNHIRHTYVELEKLQSAVMSMEKSMDESLDNSQKSFENLKNESDDLDIVLQEFGYHYEENDGENDESENHLRNNNQNCMDDSLLTIEEMPDMEVEFTPDLMWKCKAKSKESDQ